MTQEIVRRAAIAEICEVTKADNLNIAATLAHALGYALERLAGDAREGKR